MILCANPHAQFQAHQSEIEEAVLRVMRSNTYILGPEVEALESEFASYIGTRKAIGVANGTDAIELALRALGIGCGDEVITVSHTAVATVAAVEAAGSTPILVDVESKYYTLNSEQLEDVCSKKTRAVIAVHLYGQAADLGAIQDFCNKHGLALIEDASQAHGATWNGKRLGSIGDIGCFSCYPTKNLSAIGDAGLITTNDTQLATKVRALREYGWSKVRYSSEFPGRNSRLDEVQAAILRVKLKHLDSNNAHRVKLANTYNKELSAIKGVYTPSLRPLSQHVYHLFVIQVERRDLMNNYLKSNGVQAGIHYPVPVHLQEGYSTRTSCHQDMTVTSYIKDRILSLPLYPELEKDKQEKVIKFIKNFIDDNTGLG